MLKDQHDALRHLRNEYARVRAADSNLQPPDIDSIVCVAAADEAMEKGGENDAWQLGKNCSALGYNKEIAEAVIAATYCNATQQKMFWHGYSCKDQGLEKTIFYSNAELAIDKKKQRELRGK